MNHFERSWARHAKRRPYTGPDAITSEDGPLSFAPKAEPMAERKAPETQPEAQREDAELHATGGSKVSINKFALLNFVLDASADRLKSFHLETERTLGRLKVKGWRNSRVYTRAGRGVGGNPPLHDIILWLDSLEVGEKYATDIAFLKRLHNTLCTRLGV